MAITLVYALSYFYRFLSIAILVYCIGSWFVNPGSKLFDYWRKLGYFLEPIFKPAKWILSKIRFMRNVPVDFSPWLSMILLEFIFKLIIRILLF